MNNGFSHWIEYSRDGQMDGREFRYRWNADSKGITVDFNSSAPSIQLTRGRDSLSMSQNGEELIWKETATPLRAVADHKLYCQQRTPDEETCLQFVGIPNGGKSTFAEAIHYKNIAEPGMYGNELVVTKGAVTKKRFTYGYRLRADWRDVDLAFSGSDEGRTFLVSRDGKFLTLKGGSDSQKWFSRPPISESPESFNCKNISNVPVSGRESPIVETYGHQIVVFGGTSQYQPGSPTSSGATYDSISGEWKTLPSTPTVLSDVVGSVVGNHLFIVGKAEFGSIVKNYSYKYGFLSGNWEAVVLPDSFESGNIYAVASLDEQAVLFRNDASGVQWFAYDLSQLTWRENGLVEGKRLARGVSTTVKGSKVIFVDSEIDVFDFRSNIWTRMPIDYNRSRYGWDHSGIQNRSVSVVNDRLVIWGGYTSKPGVGWAIDEGVVVDLNSGARLAEIDEKHGISGRSSPGATAIGSRVVFWSGSQPTRGTGTWDNLDKIVNEISVFNVATNTWECAN